MAAYCGRCGTARPLDGSGVSFLMRTQIHRIHRIQNLIDRPLLSIVTGASKCDPMTLTRHKVNHIGKSHIIVKIVTWRKELYITPLRNRIGMQYIANNSLVFCAAYDGIVLNLMLFQPHPAETPVSHRPR